MAPLAPLLPDVPRTPAHRGGAPAAPPLRVAADGTITMAFLLLPGVEMMPLAAAVGALQAANRVMRREVFRWRLESGDGQPVATAEGWHLPVDGPSGLGADTAALWLCTGPGLPDVLPAVPDRLRRLWRSGGMVGGLGGAAFVLARAGILSGHRVTLPWEDLPGFRARWPDLSATAEPCCIDRRIATCVGGATAAEMMLQIVAAQCGAAVAEAAMQGGQLSWVRPGTVARTPSTPQGVPGRNRALQRAVAVIAEIYADPDCLCRAEAAAGVSRRQLQRLFQGHLGKTPSRHISDLRVAHGRSLLQHTDMSVAEAALASGFEQTPTFSRAFRRAFGIRPSQVTRSARH